MKTNTKLVTGALLMAAIGQIFAQPLIITHPWDQAVEAGANVTFRVVASGPTQPTYQWRHNGVDLSGANAASLILTNVQPTNADTYTVLVTDANGSATSDPARLAVHVPTLLLNLTNQWRFNQSGEELGTSWKETAFDDSNWPEGAGLFYNETRSLPVPKNTLLALTNAAGQPVVTYYFRTHFNFSGSKDGLMLVAINYVDDGAVFYMNGVEIGRHRVPNGPVTASTRAIIALEGKVDVMLFSAAPLVQGDNVLAVEVHQESVINADVVFGMSLKSTTIAPLLPDLVIPVSAKPHIALQTFKASDCEVREGCAAVGLRRLLRFNLEVRNAGTGNLELGDPVGNPHFVFDNCHSHYHYENLVSLRLLDSNGVAVASGRKIGFALSDVDRWDTTNAPPNPSAVTSTTLGITRGWADIYRYTFPCQYVDITDTPPGSYILEFDVDPDNKVAELEAANNITRFSVEIPADWAPCATPPPNDDFAKAQIVPAGATVVTGSTECATLQPGEPAIVDQFGRTARGSIWFRWTAPHSGSAVLDTQGSNFPTFMALYRGTELNRLARVAFDAEFRGLASASRIMAGVTAGETYSITVAGFYDNSPVVNRASSGEVVLNINLNTNDLFAEAQVLIGTSGTVRGTTAGTTRETGEPNHAGITGARSIWYSWTAPLNAEFIFDTFGSTFNAQGFANNNTFDTLLAVYTGQNLSALAHVASNDDVNLARVSRLSFHAIAGTTYHIAVDGRPGASAIGLCQLNWRPRLTLDSPLITGGNVRFILRCEPADDCVIETSPDLSTWTIWRSVANSNGELQLTDVLEAQTKFYRARIE